MLEECIVAIKLCSKLVKFYLDPSVFAPFLPTASSTVMSMPFTMPPYLSALEGKERLEDIRVNAFLNGRGLAGQMEALSKLHGLRRVTLDYASTDLLDVLPVWASSNMEMLKHLGIMVRTHFLSPSLTRANDTVHITFSRALRTSIRTYFLVCSFSFLILNR